jgi:hypothetical protein
MKQLSVHANDYWRIGWLVQNLLVSSAHIAMAWTGANSTREEI